MLCQKCKLKQANVHIMQIVNGYKTEQYYCQECAEKNNAVNPQVSTSNPFMPFSIFKPIEETAKCNMCGMSFNEFTSSGLFGCGECYTAFADRLEEPLKKLHGSTVHRGKIPNMVPPERSELDRLRSELNKAVADEAYEKAAKLRDKIKELEG